ncbi:MORN repeat variant [Pseudobythopirellula maris]|uniref:MORN repeat variant n=1 Tax=Pseudobythopirellula maris TaxID=2527991 RepID=A0A5C5ZM85_9BACT|nr:toxin-antitoxin system YwqK family antitoxin [Pseudobythopirellula maris]TWT88509.1 MORN repeat variant [Pseudobythopirellula maris]
MTPPAFSRFIALLVIAAFAAPHALAQSSDEALKIEPYTGPPIYLPESPPPPAPKIVESRDFSLKYEETGNPKMERTIVRYSDETVANHGPYKEYYSNGQVFTEGEYDEGDPIGEWTYYHPNGVMAKKITYRDGLAEGEVEFRNAEGVLESKRQYDAGKRDGTWKQYAEDGEQVINEQHYEKGKPAGLWRSWFKNGQLRQENPFVDGKREGTSKEWTEDGRLKATAEFKAGLRDGKTIVYQRDGTTEERVYVEGRLQKQNL